MRRFLNWQTSLGMVGVILAMPALIAAHAVVYPKQSATGNYEKYVLRVPNERDVPTVSIRLTFPSEVRVLSFADVVGWTLNTTKDSTGRIVSAEWTGELPAERFIEFPFIAVNSRSATTVKWPTTQIYKGGEVVNWDGPSDSKTPASTTVIVAGDQPTKH